MTDFLSRKLYVSNHPVQNNLINKRQSKSGKLLGHFILQSPITLQCAFSGWVLRWTLIVKGAAAPQLLSAAFDAELWTLAVQK
jgi:hypothetical protein